MTMLLSQFLGALPKALSPLDALALRAVPCAHVGRGLAHENEVPRIYPAKSLRG